MMAMITAKLAKIRWRKVQFFTVSPQEFNIGVITEFKKRTGSGPTRHDYSPAFYPLRDVSQLVRALFRRIIGNFVHNQSTQMN
jgi:hypothetical protein